MTSDRARWGQAVQVGEVLEDYQVAGQRQPADGEGGVCARLDAGGVRAEAGHPAFVDQQGGGFRAEPGEVQDAGVVRAEVVRRGACHRSGQPVSSRAMLSAGTGP